MNFRNDNETAGSRRSWAISLIRRIFALLVLAGVVGGGILYWQQADHAPKAVQATGHGGPGGPGGPAQAVPVQVVTLTPQSVPMRPEYLGQTEASQTVEIRARVAGYLESKNFEEGGRVTDGQLLFRIDPRSFEAELEMARAQLNSAEAQLARAQQKAKRYAKLLESGAATPDEMEQWQTEEIVARSNIRLNKAHITQAELDLGYTRITSPIDGLIGMAQKDVGSYVDASSNGLLAVVEKIDPIYVRYTVSEQDLLTARRMAQAGLTSVPSLKDLSLEITLADGTPYPHAGRITFTDPQIDPSTSTSVMRATVPNPDGVLKPGQFVHVRVTGVDRLNTLLVPQQAVLQNPTGAMVYVVNDQRQAELRPVTLGPWQGDKWIVESGLAAGDTVIVDRLMQLRPGMSVQPTPMAEAGQASPSAQAAQAGQPEGQAAASGAM